MESLKKLFPLRAKEVISVIGSGGKTSLIWYLAAAYRDQRVLVSPTTKMGPAKAEVFDQAYFSNFSELKNAPKGITLAGCQLPNSQKITALPEDILAEQEKHFDKILLEADGSRQLPLKGWADFEPVIPAATTITLAVLPLSALGKPATSAVVHRLPLFLAITGLLEGDIITLESLAKLICHPKGIWKNAVGRCWLFFNQVETAEQRQAAKQLGQLLATDNCQRFRSIEYCLAGSVQQKQGVNLWR